MAFIELKDEKGIFIKSDKPLSELTPQEKLEYIKLILIHENGFFKTLVDKMSTKELIEKFKEYNGSEEQKAARNKRIEDFEKNSIAKQSEVNAEKPKKAPKAPKAPKPKKEAKVKAVKTRSFEDKVKELVEYLKENPAFPFAIWIYAQEREISGFEVGKRYSMKEIKDQVVKDARFFDLEKAEFSYDDKRNIVYLNVTSAVKG